ncbi:hypothetical protein GIB67_029999 [Kingdonia uniflora]|uniref:Protein kinase domain-containing protein n=1 Tax=Kingdonia uniflora TaxID=39325 RepID=A0A7J7MXS6_9MAGN|nr:hypothetical protein GIB67_029999 [Kingdonia uniflora]
MVLVSLSSSTVTTQYYNSTLTNKSISRPKWVLLPSCSSSSSSSSSSSTKKRWLMRPRRRGGVVVRAALVEVTRDYAIQVAGGSKDDESAARVKDMKAESKALGRSINASVYTPELLSIKYGSRPIKVVRRTVEILTSLGGFAFKLLLDEKKGQIDVNKRIRAIELRRIFTRLGPTFVKLGQGLSTRPDLCPTEYLEELSELQQAAVCCFLCQLTKLPFTDTAVGSNPRHTPFTDTAVGSNPSVDVYSTLALSLNEQDALPTFPDVEAFSCIEKELGLSLDTIYSSITPSPVAAASLGQVYKARLKYSGQDVAVKVQRPGIEEAIGLDFYLIRNLGIFINKNIDIITSDVVALIDEFARRVYQELNYVQEGQNARRFKKLYADKEDVLVPDIFWDYTSVKVLTMEWVNGVKLNDQEAIEKQGLKVLDLVNTGIQCSLRQLLEYGFFHADPHPGNLLATPEGKLAFLDFGMMSETPEEARFAIIGHVVHMVNRDYEAMARDYYALDFLSADVDVSPIVPALRNFFDDALTLTVSELNFKTLVDGLGAVLYQYPFNVPAYYALILRSLTVLEGLALYADPNFKVLAASYPYFAKRLLTDPNPYLRDALIELLFKDGKFRWNRLENLLVQGRQDRDFAAKDALQPVLQLVLGPEGEELRTLVIKESIRVTEAIVLGTAIDTYNSFPDFMRTLIFNGSTTRPLALNESEQKNMLELRDQVFRIWLLLRTSESFDPSILQPIVQVLQEPGARDLGGRVFGGISRRLAARLLQQVLRAPTPASTS